MILIQLTKDDYDSISGLLVSQMHYWGRDLDHDVAQELSARWQGISSRFNPIAANESTVLWSPLCPSCKTEMAMEKNIPDQAGEMIVIWVCDNCGTIMELHIYPGEEKQHGNLEMP